MEVKCGRPADGQEPGYRSQVRYIPGTKGQGLIVCGIPGISYSLNGGQSWEKISDDSYYTIDKGNSAKVIWLAGGGKFSEANHYKHAKFTKFPPASP